MPRYVFVVVTTPDGEHLYRSPAKALKKAEDLLMEHGWEDGYFVTLTMEIRGRDVEEDTFWLERRLGRESAIANLTVEITADASRLEEELDKAVEAVEKIRARIEA